MVNLNMSGEMHMHRRNEVFGCIPHVRGALTHGGGMPPCNGAHTPRARSVDMKRFEKPILVTRPYLPAI